MEPCAIIVTPRDRFSTMARCVEALVANTPHPYELIVVAGGVPEHLKIDWLRRFGAGARCIFEPEFLNQPRARNLGLRAATARLAVVMDDDVYVRPGWLDALLQCQRETGAAMVVPVILETERLIHAAGNDLYVTYENGRAFGRKELRFNGMVLGERSNLKRQRTDYGELHCQLIDVEATLALGGFDEQIQELSEVDIALAWSKAGREMWCEPASVVYFAQHSPFTKDDIRFFAWRWDMRTILRGFRHFQQKWDLDITEHGQARDWLVYYNSTLGLLPRLFPSRLSLALDWRLEELGKLLLNPFRMPGMLLRRYAARRVGYDAWPEPTNG